MLNPIKKAMKEKGIDRFDLAILAGVSEGLISHLETGRVQTVSARILQALEDLGYDKEQVKHEYKLFMYHLKQEVLEKVKVRA